MIALPLYEVEFAYQRNTLISLGKFSTTNTARDSIMLKKIRSKAITKVIVTVLRHGHGQFFAVI